MGGEALPDVRPSALADPDDAFDPGDVDDSAANSVFPQSVASGGPTPAGVVLWTRLDGERYDPADPVRVVVAENPDFEAVVVDAHLPADRVDPAFDYTVRLDLDGRLEVDTTYYYRFVHDGVASRTGRCRTLPDPEASVESVRFGVLSCQDYENGYYGALAHIAEEDVDFLLHLGDFIYESAGGLFAADDGARYPDRNPTLPSGTDRATTLADFRALHRLYRSDRNLQCALEAHTLVAGWDDHGVSNDRYWDDARDVPVLPDHPEGDDPEVATALLHAGIRAWYENVPSRVHYDPDEEHPHESFRLYRSLRFGDLLELLVTDNRFYRDGPPPRALSLFGVTLGLGGEGDPDRSMLGDDQREWFADRTAAADTRWLGWASAVLTMPFRVGVGPFAVHPKADSTWDGFPYERKRVFSDLHDADPAVVTLSGDLHCSLAGTQRLDGSDGPAVGTEFMGPPVTSVNFSETFGVDDGLAARLARPLFRRAMPAMNPQMAFFDSHEWGYAVVEFSREACTYTAYAVDKTVDRPNDDRRVLARARRHFGREDGDGTATDAR
ncbi:alkaline phosphatase D family protein [Halomarina litorea]|uniref:alkaline phosphatase D family protein n=1 Tax=Halomarina litorea TaxID=2961595 RepID=UPI0020C49B30|nr:alkaline phosphatase D family protein [Halomarina sp. BCD28]